MPATFKPGLMLTSFLALFLAGCPSPDTCPSGMFRCATQCLPFGSVCDPTDSSSRVDASDVTGRDSPATDAPNDVPITDAPTSDANPSCAPRGTDAGTVPVIRYCNGSTVEGCRPGETPMACRPGQHCEEYVSLDHTGLYAGCFEEGSSPCNPMDLPTPQCAGAIIESCVETGPIGTSVHTDCRTVLGWADATCTMNGSSVSCTAPEATDCTESSTPPRCSDSSSRVVCRSTGSGPSRLLRVPCAAGEQCVTGRASGDGLCIPSGATTVDPPVAGSHAFRCLDETHVEVEMDGYRYSLACPVSSFFGSMGEMTEQLVCVVDGAGGFECASPREVMTCTPGTAPMCDTSFGAPARRACVPQGDGRTLSVTTQCTIPVEGTTTPLGLGCDTATATCEYSGTCATTDPATCIGGMFLVHCDATTHRWIARTCGGTGSCAGNACM